jgi:hypothetical protein
MCACVRVCMCMRVCVCVCVCDSSFRSAPCAQVVEPRGGQEYVDVVVRVPAACRACHTRAASVFAVTAHVIVVLPG